MPAFHVRVAGFIPGSSSWLQLKADADGGQQQQGSVVPVAHWETWVEF